jgi:hypothetical protein
MEKRRFLEKVDAARRDIVDAENYLGRVLREIETAPRADKTTISKVVEEAFLKLKAARANLVDLESAVTESDP